MSEPQYQFCFLVLDAHLNVTDEYIFDSWEEVETAKQAEEASRTYNYRIERRTVGEWEAVES